MPKRTPLDWEDLERELHAAGASPEEIDAGAPAARPGARAPTRRDPQAAGPGPEADRRRLCQDCALGDDELPRLARGELGPH